MNEDHAKLRELFFEIAVLEPPARAERLIKLMATDPAEHDALVRLLDNDTPRHDFTSELLMSAGLPAPPTPVADNASKPTPERIGPFRVIRLLGRGATSRVFEVEQSRPRRRVALKLLDDEVTSRVSSRRFKREIEALACLDHSGIGQVFEAGFVDIDGRQRPYFTMELIQGRPITAFALENGFSIDKKLRLVAQVADILNHAHLRGIIHRDIKPSNVLVTSDGRPVVLDFGIAKFNMSERTLPITLTGTGRIVGTLAYMSPEQALADPARVDLRADIYALGAVAFEMLAGQSPIQHVDLPLYAALVALQTDTPSKLGSFNKAYRGDIETIIACALSKSPDDRYDSASELAADIRRTLASVPIGIRAPGVIERIQKFIRRNRSGVGASAAVLTVLLAGITATTWQAAIARKRLAIVTETRNDLQDISEFQSRMLENADPAGIGLSIIAELRRQFEESLSSGITEADRGHRLAEFDAMGKWISAADLGRSMYAQEFLDPSSSAISNDFGNRRGLEARLRLNVARAYASIGERNGAVEEARRAYNIALEEFGLEDPTIVDYVCVYAQALTDAVYYTDAIALLDHVLETRRAAGEYDHAHMLLHALGAANFAANDMESAEEFFLQALRLRRAEHGESAPFTIRTEQELGDVYRVTRRFNEAQALFDHSLPLAIEQLGEGHRDTLLYMRRMATLLNVRGQLGESIALHEQINEISTQTLGEDHPTTREAMTGLAGLYFQANRLDEAEILLNRIVEVERRLLGAESELLYARISSIATVLARKGDSAGAALLYEEAIEGLARTSDPLSELTLGVRSGQAGNYVRLGQYEEAEKILIDVMVKQATTVGTAHEFYAATCQSLAKCYSEQGLYKKAEPVYRLSIESLRATFPEGHIYTSLTQVLLGRCLFHLSKYDESEQELNAALIELRGYLKPGDAMIIDVQQWLGKARQAKFDQ
ncbi:MAG: serine/threonine protein kinase [Planctomycetes bacterium]|nr:serine/threonine protein kinase [Planctomycetota bacterium]